MLKFSGLVIWRLGSRSTLRSYSAPGATVFNADKFDSSRSISDKNVPGDTSDPKDTTSLVAAAFAALNSPDTDSVKKPSAKSVKQSRIQQLDSQIVRATDVNSLLIVAENPVVSRRHALKMVSILSDWSSSHKVKLADFEKDPRFLKLCRILARSPTSQAMSSLTMAEDLSTVLGITGDDEAARLITNLSLPQMIKVMKVLNQKGRRSTPLLRALSHNITKQPDHIDLKKSADLLFSMASLNFPDPVLMDRICNDVIECLPSNHDKPVVVNSIVVSLGLLKYRHEAVLASIAEWMQDHRAVCRASDVASAVVTLATVDCLPPAGERLVEAAALLKEEEMVKSSCWLDLVFSLLTLDRATEKHLVSTLQPEFIDKLLSAGEIPIPARRKLMAIDAYVGLKFPSNSPRLPEDISFGVPIMYTKEKALYVQSIMDTFKSLVSAESFLKKECQSGMGFLYGRSHRVLVASYTQCTLAPTPIKRKHNSLELLHNRNRRGSGTDPGEPGVHRITVMGLDYHDMTRKTLVPLGVHQLYTRLLQMKGFKVLQVPYTEYNPKDKLVSRVQYIEKKLKDLVSSSTSS